MSFIKDNIVGLSTFIFYMLFILAAIWNPYALVVGSIFLMLIGLLVYKLSDLSFHAVLWLIIRIFLGGAIGFIVGGIIGFIFAYFLLWKAPMGSLLLFATLFAVLFGAIHALVFALKSIEFIEKLDRMYYWIIAGMIFWPIIGKAVGATVIYTEAEVGGAVYGLPFGALIGAIFCILHGKVGWRRILKVLCFFLAIHLALLLYCAIILEWFDHRDAFVMVATISTVWLLPFAAPPIWYDYTNVRLIPLMALLFFLCSVSIMNILMVSDNLEEHKLHQALKREGVWTSATINGCQVTNEGSGPLRYEYEVVGADGKIQRYRNSESISNCKDIRNNSQIDIRYLPQNPSQASFKQNVDSYKRLGGISVLYLALFIVSLVMLRDEWGYTVLGKPRREHIVV